MINTAPIYGDKTQLGSTAIFVRFKEHKIADLHHRVSDTPGAELMLFNYNHIDSTYTITYINASAMVLKRIAYSREAVMEVTLEESVCRVAEPAKPPLKVV